MITYWETKTYNAQGLIIKFENSKNYWENYTYNSQGLITKYETSDNYEKYSGNIVIN